MKYTPAQIRSLVGLPEQTFRNWRKLLPPLQNRNGYQPCFIAGDALALKIVNCLVKNFGVSVRKFEPLAKDLFELCQGGNWSRLEQSCLIIHADENALQATLAIESSVVDAPMFILPLHGLTHELRNSLLAEKSNEQQALRFPPIALRSQNIA